MDYLYQLNRILPNLLLRIEEKERVTRVDYCCCIDVSDKEIEIIDNTDILQFFGYGLATIGWLKTTKLVWIRK